MNTNTLSSFIVRASAALALFTTLAAAPARAVSFNMLTCCPGEQTATQARFVWHSDSSDCKFYYAKASDPGNPSNLTAAYTSKPVAFRSSDVNYYKYTVELTGLEPGTKYIYYVKSGTTQSGVQSFKTAGTSGSYNFMWTGDVHASHEAKRLCVMDTLELMRKDAEKQTASSGGIDFILFSGDAVGYGSRYDNWQKWNNAPTVTNYMFAAVSGNKEYYYTGDSSFYDYYWYLALKNNPDNGPGTTNQEGCYWFIRDSVMFVGVDSLIHKGSRMDMYNKKGEVLKAQTNWFDRVVTEQRAKKSFRYLVVFQHDPWFVYKTSASDSADKSRGNYDAWRPVFDKHKVDLALSGDEHNYVRSKPLRGDAENSDGTIYMVTGENASTNYSATISKDVGKYYAAVGTTGASCGASWIEVRPGSMKLTQYYDKYQSSSSQYKVIDTVTVYPKDRGFEYDPTGVGDDPAIPTLTEYAWKGGYDNNRIGSGKNWEEGEAPAANAGASLTFPLTGNTTVSNDYSSLSVKKITFPASNYRASFVGGPISVSECIVNNASVTNKFKNAVTFSGNIDVTGNIDFAGGVTGTVPANHLTFCGKYNLTTTDDWTPSSGSLVPSGSTLSMPNGTFYSHNGQMSIETDATVTVKSAKMTSTTTAFLLHENDGLFKATSTFTSSGTGAVYHYLVHTSCEAASEGLIALGGIKINGTARVYANSYGGKYEVAIGDSGIKKAQGATGYFLIRNDNVPQHIGSWCNGNDYKIAVVDSSGAYPTNTQEYVLYGSRTDRTYNINFDTTDCFDSTKKNTVRDMSPICGAAPANVSVGIYGAGEFRFENIAVNATGLYSGGTVVSNSATVKILKGSCPGRGDLALRDTAKLSLPDSATGTANVFGTLSLASGTTVAFGKVASGITPLSVGGLSVGSGTKPVLSVDASSLAIGTYTLISSTDATSVTGDSFTLSATGVASGNTASLVKSGNNICLKIASSSGESSGFNSTPHSRYRFAVDAPRSDAWCMQLSEIQLLDAEGHIIPSSAFTNAYDSTTLPADGSDPFPDGEEPWNAVDGSTATKWLDWRAGLEESEETRKAVWLEFHFATPTAVLGYRWFTANDSPSRTPVSWTLSYSDDNGANWVTIDKVVDYDTTTDLNALAYSKGIEYVAEYPPTTADGTYYALCVGVDLYKNPANNLSCCNPDVNNVLSACTNSTKGLWYPDNCYRICDSNATLSAVRAQFQSLAGIAQNGDTVLYYQSSHGGNDVLCLHDKDYSESNFASDLMRFKTGVRVVVLLDACHSASMFKDADGASSAHGPWNFAANVEAQMAEMREELRAKGAKAINLPSVGWMTACDVDQYSWGGGSGSTFTMKMVDAWKSTSSTDANGDGYNDFLEIFNVGAPKATGDHGEDGWTIPQKTNDVVLASVAAWEVTYHPPASNVWTGLGGNGNFSNGANWESGSAPVAGVPLDFTRLSTNATLNADIPNVAFPTAVFGSGIVTINGTLNLAALTNAMTLAVGESGTLTLSEGVVNGSAGYFLYGNKGRVNVTGTFYFDTASGDKRVIAQATESTSQGVFYFNHAHAFGGNRAYLNMGQETDGNPDLDGSTPRDHTHFVIGAGGLTSDNASYAVVRKWATVLRSAADYAIGRRTSGATDPAIAISSNYACTLYLDTADEANATVGRTVTVAGQIQSSSYIKVVAMGPGEVKFTDTSTPNDLFSRGLLATNGVTVSVAAGARPGAGDVDIADGATFSMTGSSSGSVAVGGTLKLAAGSTVSFNGLGNGVVPLTVGSLSATVTDGRKPSISVDCTGLAAGLYPLVRSTFALPADAAESLALTAIGVEAYQASLEKSGNDICLRIRSNCEWTGGAGNGDMADPANWQDGVVPTNASDVAKLDLSAATSLAGNVAVADGTTLVLPDAGTPLSITGGFTAAGGEGETVNVQLGDGGMLAKGFYILMEAASITGVENLRLSNPVAPKAKGVAEDGYEFAVYGGEGNYRLALFVRMDPPAEWVNETKETHGLTGTWADQVEYDDYGWAEIDGANSFTALQASTGRVVTVEMTARLSGGAADDGHSLDGVKAGIRIGTDGTGAVFQLYTSNDVSQVWLDVAAEGVTPTEEGADYGVKFVMDETNRTYTAAVSNETTNGAYVPLKAKAGGSAVFNFANAGESAAVSQFDFVGDGRIRSIIGTCTDAILLFSVNDEVYLADGGEPIRLSAAQAEWLNGIVGSGSGDHDAVVAALRSVGSGAIGDACLLNLDITQDGWGWTFETTSFAVVDKAGGEREITVGVRLVRDHAVQKDGKSAPINGTLALHSYDLASKSLGDAISEEVTLTNETFSDGDDATITFTPSDDGKFLKAKIKAK